MKATGVGRLRAVTTLARRLSLNPAGIQPSKAEGRQEPAPPTSYYERMTLEAKHDEPN